MSLAWTAGSVRARLLSNRRLGPVGVRRLAAAGSLNAALTQLDRTPYGREARPGMNLEAAQRGVAATMLWHLRVAGGWLPPAAGDALASLAAPFEIVNVEDRIAHLLGGPAAPPFELGRLATAWPRLATAGSVLELCSLLAASPWGDPGTQRSDQIGRVLRRRWLRRLRGSAPRAFGWARELAALHEAQAGGRQDSLPREADLWRRIDSEARSLLLFSPAGPNVVVGLAGRLAFDAWLTRAALVAATYGGAAGEAVDAVA